MLRRPRTSLRIHARFALIALLGATLLVAGCQDDDNPNDPEDVGVTVVPRDSASATATETGEPTGTATAESTETATGTATGTATATETITAPEIIERDEISFVSPEGWVGNGDTWTSPDGDVTLLFAAQDREPGSEPEAVMLPQGAVNLDREEIETPLGPGAIHTIELTEATDQGVYEMHALVRTDDRIYDWWIAAETREALDAHRDVLDQVLASVQRTDG